MKKFLALFLALGMTLSLFSCAPSLGVESSATGEVLTGSVTQETEDLGPIEYPTGFSAGFGKARVTPDVPVETSTVPTVASYVKNDLYVTCVAVCDGENVALLFGMDRKDIPESFDKQGKKILKEAFGIPEENVFFNATHSHTAPDGNDYNGAQWIKAVLEGVRSSAEDALRDLARADIYTGRGDTTGMGFSRRYIMADGSYKGIWSGNPCTEYASHETEADPELRTIRFQREGKKDIVMVNWQCHAASDAGFTINGKHVVSADFVSKLREGVEKDLDVYCSYYNGASGNLSMKSEIKGEQIYGSTDELGTALAGVVKSAVQNDKKVASGPIRASISPLTASIRKDDPEEKKMNASAAVAASSSMSCVLMLEKFGINSYYEAIHISERNKLPATQEIPLTAISFGDVAFAGAPYEMVDQSGLQIREGALFDTTFSCGYTGGAMGYMACSEMYPHGEYETYCCRFVQGTAEECVAELVSMLNGQKS